MLESKINMNTVMYCEGEHYLFIWTWRYLTFREQHSDGVITLLYKYVIKISTSWSYANTTRRQST